MLRRGGGEKGEVVGTFEGGGDRNYFGNLQGGRGGRK